MSGWRIDVDLIACLGCGVCAISAPRTFEQDDNGQAVVLEPSGDELATVQAAVEGCPTGALNLLLDDAVAP